MERVEIKIGPITFDRADYDADGDVLYLYVGEPQVTEGEQTPEGDNLRFVPGTQEIIGLTILNPRRRLELDGDLTITIPEAFKASPDLLAPGFAAV
jgi:uncharacterized protein YuzE